MKGEGCLYSVQGIKPLILAMKMFERRRSPGTVLNRYCICSGGAGRFEVATVATVAAYVRFFQMPNVVRAVRVTGNSILTYNTEEGH